MKRGGYVETEVQFPPIYKLEHSRSSFVHEHGQNDYGGVMMRREMSLSDFQNRLRTGVPNNYQSDMIEQDNLANNTISSPWRLTGPVTKLT